jgi:3-oxoacyl-[acyl-carrier protein] reductase
VSRVPSDRVALVTGASRGLGAAIARRLARDGLPVAVNYQRSAELAEALAAGLRDEGATAEAFGADVTDAAGVRKLVEAVEERLGQIGVLVLNATGPQPEAPLDETGWDRHAAHLDYFVKSPVLLGLAVLEGMKRRSSGRIVHIGSDVIARPPATQSAYVAAKSAQLGLARVWAVDLARFGITVNTVAPGWIPVERHAGAPTAALEAHRASVPAARLGEPGDVAETVRFLASPEAGFLTGQLVYVNGGRVLG